MKTNEQTIVELMDGMIGLDESRDEQAARDIAELLPGAILDIGMDAAKLLKRLNDLWDAADYSVESDRHLGPIDAARLGLLQFGAHTYDVASHG